MKQELLGIAIVAASIGSVAPAARAASTQQDLISSATPPAARIVSPTSL